MRLVLFPAYTPSQRRRFFRTAAVILIILFLLHEIGGIYTQKLSTHSSFSKPISKSISSFWPALAPLLAAAKPQCNPPKLIQNAPGRNYHTDPVQPGEELLDLTQLNDSEIGSLKHFHSWFLSQILAENAPKLDYKPDTNGIVTSAGGFYFPPTLVAIRMLRRTGSTLPVEVFLADESEYEPLICEKIFPALNARCIVLTTLLSSSPVPFKFEVFQLKIMAILFSSFQNVLFLDADNFPVRNPDELFTTAPFRNATGARGHGMNGVGEASVGSGMVLWPDFWVCTISPLFLAVINSTEKSSHQPPRPAINASTLLNRPTTESGQLLVDKSIHTSTLLLAAYYNVYGSIYYTLFTQGGMGEGDKETFPTANLVLGKPFYTVRSPVWPIGISGNGGAALIQAHPGEDLVSSEGKAAKPLFIHASWWPKLNAARYFADRRQWGSKEEQIEVFGWDVEAVARGEMVDMACDEGIRFEDWVDKVEIEDRHVLGADAEVRLMEGGICGRAKGTFRRMFGWEYNREEIEKISL
ncbi:mannosyltransferase putative-domain-containing protein [Tricladium varicosporioides]|nr:mannosyltransferase putative-domain-containing protein [Hymenoscyphus varicosporioides]